MLEETINAKDILLEHRNQDLLRYFKKPLFITKEGDYVYNGDIVKWYVDGCLFPTSGTITEMAGDIRIGCFNNVADKWKYYKIIIEEY